MSGRAALVVLVLAYGWWAVSLPPFSAAATFAVVGAGGAALAWGWRRRRPRKCPARVEAVGLWAAVLLAAVGWELAAYFQHPRADHPTLSSLMNAMLDTHALRAVAFVLWVLAAVRLARR